MIIRLNKNDKDKLKKLLLDKNMNIAAADILFESCFISKDRRISAKDIAKEFKLNLSDKEDKYFYETRILPSIKEIDEKDYLNNYYRHHILPKPFKNKEYELTYLTFKPYQLLPYDDIDIKDNFIEVSKIGYFNKPFKYLVVNKNDVTWMSTDPNEINTMKEAIESSHDNVLAFGLGLGYFPIMSAIKENVKKVVVIEKDPSIIEIFKKHILPNFQYKDKIEIVEDDAFNFLQKDLSQFDYLFIDIWHNPEDGLPLYMNFIRMLKTTNLEVNYWLEKSILAMLRRCLLTVIEESLSNYDDSNYLKAENDYDRIINELYFKTKNVQFNSYLEILDFLQDKSLKNLI